jgi:hypothetical protein
MAISIKEFLNYHEQLEAALKSDRDEDAVRARAQERYRNTLQPHSSEELSPTQQEFARQMERVIQREKLSPKRLEGQKFQIDTQGRKPHVRATD